MIGGRLSLKFEIVAESENKSARDITFKRLSRAPVCVTGLKLCTNRVVDDVPYDWVTSRGVE